MWSRYLLYVLLGILVGADAQAVPSAESPDMPLVRDKLRATWTGTEIQDVRWEVEELAGADEKLRYVILNWKGAYPSTYTNLESITYCAARFCHFNTELTRQTFPHLCSATGFIGVARPYGITQVFVAQQGPTVIDVLFHSTDPARQDETYGLDSYLFEGELINGVVNLEIKVIGGRYYLLATFFPRQLFDEPYARRHVDTYLIKSNRVDLIRSDEYKLGEVKPLHTTYPDKKTLPQPPASDFEPELFL